VVLVLVVLVLVLVMMMVLVMVIHDHLPWQHTNRKLTGRLGEDSASAWS
jgi:hypothetical protein